MTKTLHRDCKSKMKTSRFQIVLIVTLAVSVFLLSKNLGDRALWEDEAQTANLARQIMNYGLPMFVEGENIPTDTPDLSDYNDDKVFVWNTWLPYYLTAASFELFGESEFSARLPFAFFGFLSVLLYALISMRLFKPDRRLVLISIFLLVLSVPFLLHLRQCRYYSLVVFGTLWMAWGYLSLLKGRRDGWYHLAAAGIFCFYSFYIIVFLNLGGILLHAVLRERRGHVLSGLAASIGLILISTLPAVLYMRLWDLKSSSAFSLAEAWRSFWVYFLWINGFVLPFALPVLAAIIHRARGWPFLALAYMAFLLGVSFDTGYAHRVFAVVMSIAACVFYFRTDLGQYFARSFPDEESRQEGGRLFSLLAILTPLYILVMSIASPYPFYRYIIPLVPFILLYCTAIIGSVILKRNALGWVFLMTIISSNLLGAFPLKAVDAVASGNKERCTGYSVSPREICWWTGLRSDIASFSYEISHAVNDPEKALAGYFSKNGKKGEVVKTSYGDLTLMYYQPQMRIISRWDSGGGAPDYVITRGPYPLLKDDLFLASVREAEYVPIKLGAPDIVWSNNPDPLFHRYKMPEDGPYLTVYQFRRVAQ